MVLEKLLKLIKNPVKYQIINIDHYFSKSTEEFINKINKGDAIYGQNNQNKYKRINDYFRFNKITMEKINYIVEKGHLNYILLMNNLKKINHKKLI